jgi:hypothetical protein
MNIRDLADEAHIPIVLEAEPMRVVYRNGSIKIEGMPATMTREMFWQFVNFLKKVEEALNVK